MANYPGWYHRNGVTTHNNTRWLGVAASKLGPGPYESVEAFLRTHPNIERDRTREQFGMTFNPGGWLKRVR